MLRQAVFLVGGLGTRLHHLTRISPKPLMEVCGRPFIEILIAEAARHGFTDILLLAGYRGEQIRAEYDGKSVRDAAVRVLIEPEALGTGGALRFAGSQLLPQFLLANGDSFFDINLRALAAGVPTGGGVMALRSGIRDRRYGRARLEQGVIRSFHAPGDMDDGPINGGIYALDRDIVARIPQGPVFLEGTVLPDLAKEGLLKGMEFGGYFIDIGIIDDLERSRKELPTRLTRPALFLDRDGVLNVEKTYLYRKEDFEWIDGAPEAIRLANDKGWLVFVVTNQAGVAHGYYKESDVRLLHSFMQERLAENGAHIDAFEYCPHHPDAAEQNYRKACDRRKPRPGMIRDLLESWPVEAQRSLLVGDMPHDVAAAETAGIKGLQFAGGNLLDFVKPLID